VNCSHCHAVLANDARFCGACGKVMSPTESDHAIPVAAAPAMIGREVGGRYRILALLGEGGMGAVYRAEQISLKRAVAVKLLRPEVVASPALVRRFNAEAEVVAKLSHPNTVNIFDFGQDPDGTLFIAMEYIDGRSLRNVLHADGPFSVRRALAIAAQVAASLADAHAHAIVHRDLKPDNIMLQDRGKAHDIVRVLDFGIAKLRDESRATALAMTQAGDLLGTPQYMAPEQINGGAIDGRTDVYALGCLMYEMVTGRMPFEAPTVVALLSKHILEMPVPPSQRRPELGLPPSIDLLVLGSMAKEPHARYPTMEALGEQIATVLATLPPDTQRSIPVVTGGAAPAVTPAAPSAGGQVGYAQITAPPAYSATVAVPQYAVTSPRVASPAEPKDRTSLYLLIAIVVLCGGGFAVWQATKDKGEIKYEPKVKIVDAGVRDTKDPWSEIALDAAAPPHRDLIGEAVRSLELGKTANTTGLVLPLGATLKQVPGFAMEEQNGVVALGDQARGIVAVLFPMEPSNDSPETLAKNYAKTMRLEYKGLTQVTSHGGQRPAAAFTGNGAHGPFIEVVIAYITPAYRVALAIAAPVALAQKAEFQQWMQQFIEDDLVLP
jgi:serine/threonine protein kinase